MKKFRLKLKKKGSRAWPVSATVFASDRSGVKIEYKDADGDKQKIVIKNPSIKVDYRNQMISVNGNKLFFPSFAYMTKFRNSLGKGLVGKSKKKSVRKSKKKSVRKSKRKSVRKSKKKSVKKSKRKSVRKSKRKSVRKSKRKSVKKSKRKSVKKSGKKSNRRAGRPSPNTPAKNYRYLVKTGGDGRDYVSRPDKNGHFRWQLY